MLLQSADLQLQPMKEVTDDCQKTSAVSTGNIQALDSIQVEQQEMGAISPSQEPVAQTTASPCATSSVEQVSYTCKTFVKSFVDSVLYGHRKYCDPGMGQMFNMKACIYTLNLCILWCKSLERTHTKEL